MYSTDTVEDVVLVFDKFSVLVKKPVGIENARIGEEGFVVENVVNVWKDGGALGNQVLVHLDVAECDVANLIENRSHPDSRFRGQYYFEPKQLVNGSS